MLYHLLMEADKLVKAARGERVDIDDLLPRIPLATTTVLSLPLLLGLPLGTRAEEVAAEFASQLSSLPGNYTGSVKSDGWKLYYDQQAHEEGWDAASIVEEEADEGIPAGEEADFRDF